LKAISRWLSAATPPVYQHKNSIPRRGCSIQRDTHFLQSGIP